MKITEPTRDVITGFAVFMIIMISMSTFTVIIDCAYGEMVKSITDMPMAWWKIFIGISSFFACLLLIAATVVFGLFGLVFFAIWALPFACPWLRKFEIFRTKIVNGRIISC